MQDVYLLAKIDTEFQFYVLFYKKKIDSELFLLCNFPNMPEVVLRCNF